MNMLRSSMFFAKICIVTGLAIVVALSLSYYFFASPPKTFTSEIVLTVNKGQGALGIANELKDLGLVKSSKVTASLMTYLEGERKIKAGIYIFKTPESAFTIARRIVDGDYGYIPLKITVPEGSNYKQLAEIIFEKFNGVSTSTLETELKPLEGYLFPDTYFFPPIVTDKDIIKKMQDTFVQKTSEIEFKVAERGTTSTNATSTATGTTNNISNINTKTAALNFAQVITLASILEEEVNTQEDRRMVADLLIRRLNKGMPLQVDATLRYVTGKSSAELTLKDLKADNPYNTYTRKGLPPTPISNPGLETIEAVLNPTPNDYVFYLSDKDGITHFAKTLEEHARNKKKYL